MARTLLYTQAINPFSEKVARALNYKGLPYERVVSNDAADVRRWSPATGMLPVLEIDGKRVADSAKILRWLDEVSPDRPLLSADPRSRAAQESLADWSDTSFLWYWDRWRAARFPQPGDERPAAPGLLDKLRVHLRGGSQAPTRAQVRELEVMDGIAARLDDLVGFLGTRGFFYSDSLSVADLSVYGMLWTIDRGPMPSEGLLSARPPLQDYMGRMEALTAEPAGAHDASWPEERREPTPTSG